MHARGCGGYVIVQRGSPPSIAALERLIRLGCWAEIRRTGEMKYPHPAPAARITLPHFSVSAAMSLPKSVGEPGSTLSPRSRRVKKLKRPRRRSVVHGAIDDAAAGDWARGPLWIGRASWPTSTRDGMCAPKLTAASTNRCQRRCAGRSRKIPKLLRKPVVGTELAAAPGALPAFPGVLRS